MNAPPQAIQPLRDRLMVLKKHQEQTPDVKRGLAIQELEALIKRLENPNAPWHP